MPVRTLRFQRRRAILCACLPCCEHGLRIGIFDPSVCDENGLPDAGIKVGTELKRQFVVVRQSSNESPIVLAGVCRDKVDIAHGSSNILAAVIDGPLGGQFTPKI